MPRNYGENDYDGEYHDYLGNDDYDDEEEDDDLDDYDDDDYDDDDDDFDDDDDDDEDDDLDDYDEGYNGNGDLRGGSSEELTDVQPEYIH